ncbi:MAG: family 78 glycoside hydrolase catalytic domain [Calditrichaeota bacterium]|nr:family 78 glycoside hydrolase catalytic domain [Calditrichota bacterium]
MKNILILILILTIPIMSQAQMKTLKTKSSEESSLRPISLTCEYLQNPLGVDVQQPRFFWKLESDQNGVKQSAYRILVSGSKEVPARNNGEIWDSGKTESDETTQIVYQGKPLESGKMYFWKVQVWDQNNAQSTWSESAFFSMGMLHADDWKVQWIGAPPEKPYQGKGDPPIPPSPLLRKSFSADKKVKRAMVYVSALGDYELHLNGTKVGNHVLSPEWTDYHKRVQYQTFDVTEKLVQGENVIAAILGDGWYAGRLGPVRWDKNYPRRGPYGLDRRLLMQMEIEYTDGNKDTIVSDGSWKIYLDGPIRSADNFLGEIQDARKRIPGWDKPGFNESQWQPVSIGATPSGKLVAQMNEPIRIVKQLHPIAVTEPTPGVYIFDLGQNMVGWCRIRLHGAAGTEITLRHGEMLNLDGTLYTANLAGAIQTDKYILYSKGEQAFEPHFTFHGFRYVEVTGLTEKPSLEILTGMVVSSDMQRVGRFECSNPLLNKLMQNIVWGQRGNMLGVPTDCPQRDERMGWMGDAQVFAQTGIFNMNTAAFFSKWVKDIRDAQTADGRYPDFAPQPFNPEKHFSDAPGWADAGIIVPWRLWENYADKRILAQHYESAKRFIENIRKNNPNLLWENSKGNKYSDWLNGDKIKAKGYPKSGAAVPYLFYTTAYYSYSTKILAEMAQVLGKTQDAKFYAHLVDQINAKIVDKFVSPDGRIQGDTQAGYALALNFKLLPPELERKAASHLFDAVKKYDDRISTGFHSTLPLMKELAHWGYTDLAYKLVESTRFPSWGYSIKQGATTVWERWDAFVAGRGFQNPSMNSFNHYAYGAVGEWMYRTILGINPDDAQPGFKHFFIAPQPGGYLTWAKGEYNSIHGKIAVDWKRADGKIILKIQTPTNTSATVTVPTSDPANFKKLNPALPKDVEILKVEKKAVTLSVQGGKYAFIASFEK